jgi:uncharacterized protein (DUF952 family)
MPKIVGKAFRVVDDAENGLTIDEYAGNVGSKDDTMSLAVVKVSKPCSEPWLTLDYDEWIAILKGRVDFYYAVPAGVGSAEDDQTTMITAIAGDTVFVARGERFRPVFPEGGTEYVPVCIPAFKPERCLREEDGGTNTSETALKLKQFHTADQSGELSSCGVSSSSTMPSRPTKDDDDDDAHHPDTLYHMCNKSLWEDAVARGKAYFPPTFVADGNFTHATAVPDRLLVTANHFYTSSVGDWICLQLSATALKDKCGIITIFEEPKPVGEADVSNDWTQSQWICPHIFGGIPVTVEGIVTAVYPIIRDEADGRFLSIEGLVL